MRQTRFPRTRGGDPSRSSSSVSLSMFSSHARG
nr:MAG TPA: hypothetical protein [Caudoviricetes sp.]